MAPLSVHLCQSILAEFDILACKVFLLHVLADLQASALQKLLKQEKEKRTKKERKTERNSLTQQEQGSFGLCMAYKHA